MDLKEAMQALKDLGLAEAYEPTSWHWIIDEKTGWFLHAHHLEDQEMLHIRHVRVPAGDLTAPKTTLLAGRSILGRDRERRLSAGVKSNNHSSKLFKPINQYPRRRCFMAGILKGGYDSLRGLSAGLIPSLYKNRDELVNASRGETLMFRAGYNAATGLIGAAEAGGFLAITAYTPDPRVANIGATIIAIDTLCRACDVLNGREVLEGAIGKLRRWRQEHRANIGDHAQPS